ncbi:hypothetical protein AIOL_002237 [Candidatus Rhodobacter oscarellae]|uniref:Uncharacterized protein n=1 Tax=Candidatus Rhodobacter oscarellae TaxID=1675527 RepID=A0A0J9E353_9RHOB|nr:DoxX family protein [Candidatus Rhodobacter lobularis]KMW57276.1 hypothetical protein AIOL_002237 [Candidatus Rhodobacter lobularis]
MSIVRILIASYFLASATGLVFDPSTRTFLDPILPRDAAVAVTTAYLFITAFAVMVGFCVRPAALLLAVYVFWSAFSQFGNAATVAALSVFWQNMALMGALLLIAITVPGGNTRFTLWARRIAPRRVNRQDLKNVVAKRSARPIKQDELLTRDAILTGATFIPAAGQTRRKGANATRDAAGEPENLFEDAWEPAKRHARMA